MAPQSSPFLLFPVWRSFFPFYALGNERLPFFRLAPSLRSPPTPLPSFGERRATYFPFHDQPVGFFLPSPITTVRAAAPPLRPRRGPFLLQSGQPADEDGFFRGCVFPFLAVFKTLPSHHRPLFSCEHFFLPRTSLCHHIALFFAGLKSS